MFLLPSKFGYIITGWCADTNAPMVGDQLNTLFVGVEVSQVVQELCSQCTVNTPAITSPRLEDLWCLENTGISDSPFVEIDDKALQKFNETIKFDKGRYGRMIVFTCLIITILPWQE